MIWVEIPKRSFPPLSAAERTLERHGLGDRKSPRSDIETIPIKTVLGRSGTLDLLRVRSVTGTKVWIIS